jgi:hypothetical protein
VGVFLAGVMLHRLLGLAAAGCVLRAIANVGLAATEHGGSYLLGGGLLGAALALLTAGEVLRRLARP